MHQKVVLNLLESEKNEVKNIQDCLDPLLELAIEVFELNITKHDRNKWYVNGVVIKHTIGNGDVFIEFKKKMAVLKKKWQGEISCNNQNGQYCNFQQRQKKIKMLYMFQESQKNCRFISK